VFTLANGDPILPRWDADMWNAILEKAGVEHTRIYSMRHTAINFQLLAGAPIEAVSVGAGHGTTGFTERAYGGNRDALGFGLAAFVGDD
jgi:integrase